MIDFRATISKIERILEIACCTSAEISIIAISTTLVSALSFIAATVSEVNANLARARSRKAQFESLLMFLLFSVQQCCQPICISLSFFHSFIISPSPFPFLFLFLFLFILYFVFLFLSLCLFESEVKFVQKSPP